MIDILAIGGGSAAEGETRSIDQLFVARTGKKRPNLLFVPTASMDSAEYCDSIAQAYGGLGCEVRDLRLWSTADVERQEACLAWADAIYVGGGNTKAMLARWREIGFDERLLEAARDGKPVGGLSAGAICWFRVGNSDWPQYENIPNVLTARLDCLGLVDLVLCPHTRNEPFRLSDFREMMRQERGVGLGLDDGCAIHVLGDRYRILASQPQSVAHRIEWHGGWLYERVIEPHEDYRPLSSLTTPE